MQSFSLIGETNDNIQQKNSPRLSEQNNTVKKTGTGGFFRGQPTRANTEILIIESNNLY